MHFGKQLKFLAYPPWKHEYIDYSMLKRTLHAVMDAGKAQGRTKTVTVAWIVAKDEAANAATPAPAQSTGATPRSSTDSARKKDKKSKKDKEDDKSTASATTTTTEGEEGEPRRSSIKDFVRKKRNQVQAMNTRRTAEPHELKHLVRPETPQSPAPDESAAAQASTTTTTTAKDSDVCHANKDHFTASFSFDHADDDDDLCESKNNRHNQWNLLL